MNRTALSLTLATLLLTACSNSQEASKANFKNSINQYSQNHSVCLPLSLEIQTAQGFEAQSNTMLGEQDIRIADTNAQGNSINKDVLKQMAVLTTENFYKETDTSTLPSPDGEHKIKVHNYSLTEKGHKQTRQSPQGPLFCLGSEKIEEIKWFTEPTPANGVTVSKVAYVAKLEPESWAKKLIKRGGDNWQALLQKRDKMATLVKTNEGWRDIRELH